MDRFGGKDDKWRKDLEVEFRDLNEWKWDDSKRRLRLIFRFFFIISGVSRSGNDWGSDSVFGVRRSCVFFFGL